MLRNAHPLCKRKPLFMGHCGALGSTPEHRGEYFLFDPRGEWIPERLRGFNHRDGVYQPIPLDPQGRLPSLELGLELAVVNDHIRFFEPEAQAPLPTRAERAEQERGRAERAEQELERLKAELERVRRGDP